MRQTNEQDKPDQSVHPHLDGQSDEEHDPSRPWTNTRPRGAQPEADAADYERSVERFSALVGR